MRSSENLFLKFLYDHDFKVGFVFTKKDIKEKFNLICMLPKNFNGKEISDIQLKNLKVLLKKNGYEPDTIFSPLMFNIVKREKGYIKKFYGKNLSELFLKSRWKFNVMKTNDEHPLYAVNNLNVEVYNFGILIQLHRSPKILEKMMKNSWYRR